MIGETLERSNILIVLCDIFTIWHFLVVEAEGRDEDLEVHFTLICTRIVPTILVHTGIVPTILICTNIVFDFP